MIFRTHCILVVDAFNHDKIHPEQTASMTGLVLLKCLRMLYKRAWYYLTRLQLLDAARAQRKETPN